MGEIKLFQICYEGNLTVDVSHAMRRLGAEPNFDQSWQVWLPEGRHAAPLVRYVRAHLSDEARLLVASIQFTATRDFLGGALCIDPSDHFRTGHGPTSADQRHLAVRRFAALLGRLAHGGRPRQEYRRG